MTGTMPLYTQGASIPSNYTGECLSRGRCPDMTRVRSGCVFGSSIISQQVAAEDAHAPALCKLRSDMYLRIAANAFKAMLRTAVLPIRLAR